ncbi:MAG: hypothetical protein ACRBN8_28890 [Nannocystales bacterium]
MGRRPLYCALGCCALLGCHDQVVGAFSSSGSGGSGGGTTAVTVTSENTDTSSGPDASSSAANTGEDGPFVGCFSDEFDDEMIDTELWNPFADAGAALEEVDGTLLLTPAPSGLAYSGVTLGFAYRYQLERGWVRATLLSSLAAADPVNVYLRAGEDDGANYTVRVGGGTLSVTAPDETGADVQEDHPEFGDAQAIGIRGDGNTIVFEASQDGELWQTIATRPATLAVERTKLLLMLETVGDGTGVAPVAVERIEACAE